MNDIVSESDVQIYRALFNSQSLIGIGSSDDSKKIFGQLPHISLRERPPGADVNSRCFVEEAEDEEEKKVSPEAPSSPPPAPRSPVFSIPTSPNAGPFRSPAASPAASPARSAAGSPVFRRSRVQDDAETPEEVQEYDTKGAGSSPQNRRYSQDDRHKQRERERERASPTKDVDEDKAFEDTQYVPRDFTEADVQKENMNHSTRRVKQDLLFQLSTRFKSSDGMQWSMNMPLSELKYELYRRDQFEKEQKHVKFMTKILKWVIKGLEAGNNYAGPFLDLTDWADSITEDMSEYESALRSIYQTYFRRNSMNPVLELAILIVGSAISTHLSHKMRGKKPSRVNRAPQADIEPPPMDYETRPPAPTKKSGLSALFGMLG